MIPWYIRNTEVKHGLVIIAKMLYTLAKYMTIQ
jgi:hypothetical protein